MNDGISFAQKLKIIFEFWKGDTDDRAIAAEIGISHTSLYRLRTGITLPNINMAMALADYFGIGLDYFTCRTEAECREYFTRQKGIYDDPVLQEVVSELLLLPEEELQNVSAILSWIETNDLINFPPIRQNQL